MTDTADVTVETDGVRLDGILGVPEDASGVVVFAHGAGSSRHSPRNNAVAEALRDRGLATLLFDLLTEQEDRARENRFDIPLLTERLVGATRWLRERPETTGLPLGYFGASTGAAAALQAAARPETNARAVVSRGGRVDLAGDALDDVTAACLFVVGGDDTQVIELNRDAYDRLPGEKALRVVEGAGHLFDRPGELEAVAEMAGDWFVDHL